MSVPQPYKPVTFVHNMRPLITLRLLPLHLTLTTSSVSSYQMTQQLKEQPTWSITSAHHVSDSRIYVNLQIFKYCLSRQWIIFTKRVGKEVSNRRYTTSAGQWHEVSGRGSDGTTVVSLADSSVRARCEDGHFVVSPGDSRCQRLWFGAL